MFRGESDDDWEDDADDWGDEDDDGTEELPPTATTHMTDLSLITSTTTSTTGVTVASASTSTSTTTSSADPATLSLFRTPADCRTLYQSWTIDSLNQALDDETQALARDLGLLDYCAALKVKSGGDSRSNALDIARLMLRLYSFRAPDILSIWMRQFECDLANMLQSFPRPDSSSSSSSSSSSDHHHQAKKTNLEWARCVQQTTSTTAFECQICVEEFSLAAGGGAGLSLGCGHMFCVSCWRDLVRNAMRSKGVDALMIECPSYQCGTLVPDALVEHVLLSKGKADVEKWQRKKAKLEVTRLCVKRGEHFVACSSQADCGGVYSTVFFRNDEAPLVAGEQREEEEGDEEGEGEVEEKKSDGAASASRCCWRRKRRRRSRKRRWTLKIAERPFDLKAAVMDVARKCAEMEEALEGDGGGVPLLLFGGGGEASTSSGLFEVEVGRSMPLFVQCDECASRRCLVCDCEEWHSPANCYLVQYWRAKCARECENAKWIITNTKKCPECLSRIEKSHGCNHMICAQCRHEFCWVCMGPWKEHGNHTGGFYKCHKYIYDRRRRLDAAAAASSASSASGSAAASATGSAASSSRGGSGSGSGGGGGGGPTSSGETSSRKSAKSKKKKAGKGKKGEAVAGVEEETEKEKQDEELYKFVHYYNRYHSHSQSKDFLLREAAKERDELMQETRLRIARCRRILQYTYVFGYYMSASRPLVKDLFEFLQESLEKNTEYLHELCESDGVDPAHIRNYEAITSGFADKLLDGIQAGLI